MSLSFYYDLISRFRFREDTYKTRERAARAFYRWVCKEGLYRTMRRRVDHQGRTYYARTGGPGFTYGAEFRYGYPIFRTWRNSAYDAWSEEFRDVRQRWQDEADAIMRREHQEREDELEAVGRSFDVEDGHDYFEVAAAAENLTKL